MKDKTFFFGSFLFALIFGAIGGAMAALIVIRNVPSFGQQEVLEDTVVQVVEESDIASVVESATPSVVSIVVKKEYTQAFDPSIFSDEFSLYAPEEEEISEEVQVGSGSGFVVSSDGLIMTNRHVVEDTQAEYEVVFDDGKTYPATVLDRDQIYDLAILQIDATDITPLPLGDSNTLAQGQTVIAIGNTAGQYPNTVTKGIISGLARNLEAGYSGLIQTDAAINSGNSGGPLLNAAGQVIGVNTAVDRSGEGIGFAIPINDVRVAIESVKQYGAITRAGLGVRYQMINEEIAKRNDLPYTYGAYITSGGDGEAVLENSSAAEIGLGEGDIILEIDGVRVDSEQSLAQYITAKQIGERIRLKIYQDNEEKESDVVLKALPKENENVSSSESESEKSEEENE